MHLNDKITISSQVVARRVGSDTVILHLGSGTYFGLDPLGSRIWQLMGEGNTLAEICELMLPEYDVTREVLQRDALSLAQNLVAENLINTANSSLKP